MVWGIFICFGEERPRSQEFLMFYITVSILQFKYKVNLWLGGKERGKISIGFGIEFLEDSIFLLLSIYCLMHVSLVHSAKYEYALSKVVNKN